jgi:hypothetical protein
MAGCWPGCPQALLSTRHASALVDQAVAVLRRPGFDTLLSLPQLAFEPFDYQRETASTCCAACAAGRSWPTKSGWVRPSKPA